MTIRSDRRYPFDHERAGVWQALSRVDDYPTWWPWLKEFDGVRLAAGERWRCAVRPQLPYTLRFVIELTEVADTEHACARLEGDIRGWARITLTDYGRGSEVRLVSDLDATGGLAGLIDRLVHPLAAAGHDWVLDNGIRQFRRRAFSA